jgi:two-component system sensor histidine kinase HydH
MAGVFSKLVRTEDFVWLLLFSAMALASPIQDPPSLLVLSALALFQVLEPRIAYFDLQRGKIVGIIIKLVLGFLLIGYTDAINSSYYPILLVPVVAAATSLGGWGTALFTALACVSYLSFLLFLDWSDWTRYTLDWRELLLRLVFLPVVGYLTHTLADSNREEARKYQAAAEQLEVANQHLQEAEAAMRRSERLAALGQLTAGLAHELRNPMGTIRASAEMLTKIPDGGNEVMREMAGFVMTEVDRANSLITRFLEFARPVPLRLAKTDLTAAIDRAVAQLGPQPVTVYKNYSPDIPPFLFDAELMERVFHNLILNAVQATQAGGAVTVKTRMADGQVEISVIDRGSGINPEQIESIFNPFFTTKPDGVGLGLAIVSKIVDEHGGTIAVTSEKGKGSLFRVLLPLAG